MLQQNELIDIGQQSMNATDQQVTSHDVSSDAGRELVESEGSSDDASLSLRLSASIQACEDHCQKVCSKQVCHVLLASFLAALGGLLFGYDTGIISGALLQLGDVFHLSCHEKELLVSVMLIGALIAALVSGNLVDRIGRRLAVIINAVIFTIGSIVLALSVNFPMMIFGRLVIGFGVSLSAIAECIYISEISPSATRGFLVSLNEFSITVGFLLAYLVNYLLITVDNGWRYMFSLGAIPAVIQGIGMLYMPKSPRYLLLQQNEYEARNVLLKLRPSTDVDEEMREIKEAINREKYMSYKDLLKTNDNMILRLAVSLGLVIFQQITGQPNVLYYAPTVFQQLGFRSSSAATLASVGLGAVKVVFTGLALFFLDRCGRRRMLVSGASIMMVSMLMLGLVTNVCRFAVYDADPCSNATQRVGPPAVDGWPSLNATSADENVTTYASVGTEHVVDRQTNASDSPPIASLVAAAAAGDHDVNKMTSASTSSQDDPDLTNARSHRQVTWSYSNGINGTKLPTQDGQLSAVAVWLTFISLMFFVGGYAIGFGPGTWLVLSEIFPATIRGRAMSCAVIFNWLFNLIITSTFLDTMSAVGVSATFFCYAAICGLSVVFILFCVPETKGKSLEEITLELNKWSVKQQVKDCHCCGSASVEMPVRYQRIEGEMTAAAAAGDN